MTSCSGLNGVFGLAELTLAITSPGLVPLAITFFQVARFASNASWA